MSEPDLPAPGHDRPFSATDSAGTPWAGRRFEENSAAADDGSAPPGLIDAITRFHAGEVGESVVVDAFRMSRLLVPILAELAESGVASSGLTVDKSAELSIVTVAGPDGRPVLPVFTSVGAMSRWNPKARPVPADAVRVALAAASEGTELVVLDAGSPTEFVLRRPAVWAVAQQRGWRPSYDDPAVIVEFQHATADALIRHVEVTAGDPGARLAGPEIIVAITVVPSLSAHDLSALLARVQPRWAENEVIVERVDSVTVRFLSEPTG